jgi:hypothetical protein
VTNTTILVDSKTRKLLAEVGKKNQTYNEIIRELIKLRMDRNSTGSTDLET